MHRGHDKEERPQLSSAQLSPTDRSAGSLAEAAGGPPLPAPACNGRSPLGVGPWPAPPVVGPRCPLPSLPLVVAYLNEFDIIDSIDIVRVGIAEEGFYLGPHLGVA